MRAALTDCALNNEGFLYEFTRPRPEATITPAASGEISSGWVAALTLDGDHDRDGNRTEETLESAGTIG